MSARRNMWPFSGATSHGTVAARGGIAAQGGHGGSTGHKYRGYTIYKTSDGEYFSSLDRDSWFESLPQLKRFIDSWEKGHGRENPSKFDRCVQKVKKSGRAVNAYAVCTSAGLRGVRRVRKNAPLPVLVPLDIWDVEQLDAAGKGIFKALKTNSQRNPLDAASEMYEEFHGKPSEKVTEVVEEVHEHSALAELGVLKELRVKARDGGIVSLSGFGHALLCSNEEGTQLYIRGGDQTVNLSAFGIEEGEAHDLEDLGEVKQIRYFTTKEHLGQDGGKAVYYHNFGEEDVEEGNKARRPRLIYSTRDGLLSLVGGAYDVKPEGIAN